MAKKNPTYTPTIDVVRHRYAEFPYVAQLEHDPGWEAGAAEFDAWRAEHESALIERVLEQLRPEYSDIIPTVRARVAAVQKRWEADHG